MGVYYLQHPVHGIHVATTDVEAANCKANGWSDWSPGDPDPVLSPRLPVPEVKAKSAESEVEVLKAQMAALLARLDAAENKVVEEKPAKKAAAAPAVPDFLKDATKPQG
jgi:hypothetical protein